jgi:hypothetical protein
MNWIDCEIAEEIYYREALRLWPDKTTPQSAGEGYFLQKNALKCAGSPRHEPDEILQKWIG